MGSSCISSRRRRVREGTSLKQKVLIDKMAYCALFKISTNVYQGTQGPCIVKDQDKSIVRKIKTRNEVYIIYSPVPHMPLS
jgi:hypothetical protein